PVRNQAMKDRVESDEIDFRVVADIQKHLLPTNGIIGVPRQTDALAIHHLHQLGVQTQPVQSLFHEARETKDRTEIQAIRKATKATEATFQKLFDIIQNCEIGPKRQLFNNGKPLTVGYLKQVIEHSLVDNSSENSEESIVAGGKRSSDFHYLGRRRDILRAHEPIIIDIYPRRIEERYHADITRTVVRGTVSKKLQRLFESVNSALNAVIDAMTAGTTTDRLVYAMIDAFEKDGHHTTYLAPGITEGMLHGLGHGIGLEVHEYPHISIRPCPVNRDSVIAIEPGLYYPQIGGVRIENDILITSKGAQSLTSLPKIIYL
ncbi:MAG: Xaa-Pro peptidase family protein, partial [Candidatus Hermodarchaeota archaeon]|nr:Xaa-Pro peptidase family protein [Candidatus Hermodarchaeota archaeon]